MASYPDFICVGAQKAATSWLYRVLRWTPGIFLPALGELHYFSAMYSRGDREWGHKRRAFQIADLRAAYNKKKHLTKYDQMVLAQLDHMESEQSSDDWYRGIFGFAKDTDICGEICPCYMSIPMRGVRHVMSINPLVRVIVLVRDPVDRVWSQMRMNTKNGTLDFDLDKILSGVQRIDQYMLYTDYANAIRRWKFMAGEGRFRAILYDRIGDEPREVIREILEFVGAEHDQELPELPDIVFPGEKVDLPIELRDKLFADLQPQYEFLYAMFPEQVEAWVERHKEALVC